MLILKSEKFIGYIIKNDGLANSQVTFKESEFEGKSEYLYGFCANGW